MEKLNPIRIAYSEFCGGVTFDKDCMRLNGIPISTADLMREVNKRRAERGEDQIVCNPMWEVKCL